MKSKNNVKSIKGFKNKKLASENNFDLNILNSNRNNQ